MLVAAQLRQFVINEKSEQQLLVLKETSGSRTLQIMVGIPEILSIDRSLKKQKTPRPMTHELLLNTISVFDAKLSKVLITDHYQGVYFAMVELCREGKVYRLDSRPSDAIALALYEGVEILIEDSIFSDEK